MLDFHSSDIFNPCLEKNKQNKTKQHQKQQKQKTKKQNKTKQKLNTK